MEYKDEIIQIIRNVTKAAGKEIPESLYIVNDLGVPHVPEPLKPGYYGVYIFIYQDKFLKIGKVGPNSNARFISQHYSPKSANSTLAASILDDKDMRHLELNEDTIGNWIKNNCKRINVFLSAELPNFTNELIETALHYRFQPKYEGVESQRKR